MKRIIFNLISILFIASLSGCAYSKVTLPLDTDVNETDLGDKEGRASVSSLLWLVAWGDAGVNAAAKNGNITTVKHLDVEQHAVFFGIYTKVTTIAYGE
jgi:hypothetical protein